MTRLDAPDAGSQPKTTLPPLDTRAPRPRVARLRRSVVTAAVLVILVMNVRAELLDSYQGYPQWATTLGGWGILVALAVLGWFLWRRQGKAGGE